MGRSIGKETMKEIALTKGKITIVDDEDYATLSKHKWHTLKIYHSDSFYARRNEGLKAILMHRVILGAKHGQCVDHANGDSLDNRRSNIRICTRSENQCNQKKSRFPKSSKYKGVYWDTKRKNWRAQIVTKGRKIRLGSYRSETEAARVRDLATIKYHGEYGLLNFKKPDPR